MADHTRLIQQQRRLLNELFGVDRLKMVYGWSMGAQQAYHLVVSGYGYVRVRISSAITGGGTVVVTARMQGAS